MAGPTNGSTRRLPVGRVLVLGYYDGATDGVLQVAEAGPVYRFELDDESDLAPDATARLYTLRPLPADAMERLTTVLSPHLSPKWPVWCPSWRFPSPEVQRQVEAAVEVVLVEAGPAAGVMSTTDPYTLGDVTLARGDVPVGI